MGIIAQVKAVFGAGDDKSNQARSGANVGGKSLSALAGIGLGTLGTLTAPALLPPGEGPLKVTPDIGNLSLDKLVPIGIRPVAMEGFVGVVNIKDVSGGSELSFELKSPGAAAGIEVVHEIPGFKDSMHDSMRFFLESEVGKPKHCYVEGYITSGSESRPVVNATSLTFSPASQPYRPDTTPKPETSKSWSTDDIKSLGRMLSTDTEK